MSATPELIVLSQLEKECERILESLAKGEQNLEKSQEALRKAFQDATPVLLQMPSPALD